MEAVPGLAAVLTGARDLVAAFPNLSDEQLLAALGDIEELGRIGDALRITVAAEVEQRSDLRLGEGRLAFRNGARDGVELVQQVARISHREAKRRVAMGAALAPDVSLTGELLPGRFPAVAAAVGEGRIGLESARVIANAWKEVHPRADQDGLDAMVESLIGTATSADTETVEEAAGCWPSTPTASSRTSGRSGASGRCVSGARSRTARPAPR